METNRRTHIVVLTGAGISAESGISTYRDKDGLWTKHDHAKVASPQAWKKDRAGVLAFWNARRQHMETVEPNEAHRALVRLEQAYDVSVITQNVDNLHERAGSSSILHLHGEIMKARSSFDHRLIYDWPKDIEIGQKCERGSQLRPHVVWFGEQVPNMPKAYEVAQSADIMIVIGTSLTVYPAALLAQDLPRHVDVYHVNPYMDAEEDAFHIRAAATEGVPALVDRLLEAETG